MTTTIEKRRVTVYFDGGLGYAKIEASAFCHSVGPYAQYKAAVTLRMVRKGERKVRGTVYTSPTFVILDGWGHPDPDGAWTDVSATESVGRHAGFAPEWTAEFSAKIDAYVASGRGKVVCDYRGHQTY